MLNVELPEVTTTCDAEDYHISAVQEESQKEVIKAIQNVLPIIPGMPLTYNYSIGTQLCVT